MTENKIALVTGATKGIGFATFFNLIDIALGQGD